jgi:hypothetical protein
MKSKFILTIGLLAIVGVATTGIAMNSVQAGGTGADGSNGGNPAALAIQNCGN